MKYILTLLIGLVLGLVLAFYFLGVSHAKMAPGTLVKPPEQGGDEPGTAVLTLDEKFFDALLGKIFKDMGAPTFPLQLGKLDQESAGDGGMTIRPALFQAGGGGCQNQVVLANEGSNVRTGVRFGGGKIQAPMAFTGSYNLLGSCWQFKGWAQTGLQLSFDEANQKLYGQVSVEGVNLEGISPAVGGLITPLVQRTINERVNPVEMLRAEQLTLNIPVKATNNTLSAHVKTIHSEVADGALRLHITYDFLK
jgi:hypothetical protein